MEVRNEMPYFKSENVAKNLVLAEVSDQPHLINCIKDAVKGEFFFFTEEHTFSNVMNEIIQPSLFGDKKVFIILSSEEYSDQEWDVLFQEKEAICFIFKTKVKKSLLEKFNAEGKVLSLIEEKPWDRKNRLVKEVIYTIHKDGVMISQPTAFRFVERVHTDLHLFYSELSKLRCFAESKKSLEDSDIDELIKPLPEENSFKVTEELIWNGQFPKHFIVDSPSLLLQILGAIRFQAYLGLKLLSSEGETIPLWQEKKYKQKAQSFGDAFFTKILALAFKAEQRVKQSTITPTALFDLISIEIVGIKTRYS